MLEAFKNQAAFVAIQVLRIFFYAKVQRFMTKGAKENYMKAPTAPYELESLKIGCRNTRIIKFSAPYQT